MLDVSAKYLAIPAVEAVVCHVALSALWVSPVCHSFIVLFLPVGHCLDGTDGLLRTLVYLDDR